jgi:hypothetical protein
VQSGDKTWAYNIKNMRPENSARESGLYEFAQKSVCTKFLRYLHVVLTTVAYSTAVGKQLLSRNWLEN